MIMSCMITAQGYRTLQGVVIDEYGMTIRWIKSEKSLLQWELVHYESHTVT
jgi:hypothetical protein